MNQHDLSARVVATSENTPEEKRSAERRAKYFWVSLVVTLLSFQIAIGAVAIHLATSDPTVSMVPNYHQTALNWDQQKHVTTAANRMGWTIDLTASDVADGQGRRALEIAVQDQNGDDVNDLRLLATAYHHAAASDVRSFTVDSIGEGSYLALAPLERSGIWNLQIEIAGAEEPIRFLKTIEVIQ